MTMQTVKKLPGRPPGAALTLRPDGKLYLPMLTYYQHFEERMAVLLHYDREERLVSIEPCGRYTPNAAMISFPTRSAEIRCGSLLRQFRIKLTKPVRPKDLFLHKGWPSFHIPLDAMEEGQDEDHG